MCDEAFIAEENALLELRSSFARAFDARMVRSSFSSSGGSNVDTILADNRVAAAAYRIPSDVIDMFVVQHLSAPCCYELMSYLVNPAYMPTSCYNKAKSYLRTFIASLDYDALYFGVVDVLLWCGSLTRMFQSCPQRKYAFKWLCALVLETFKADITDNRDRECLKNATSQLDSRKSTRVRYKNNWDRF